MAEVLRHRCRTYLRRTLCAILLCRLSLSLRELLGTTNINQLQMINVTFVCVVATPYCEKSASDCTKVYVQLLGNSLRRSINRAESRSYSLELLLAFGSLNGKRLGALFHEQKSAVPLHFLSVQNAKHAPYREGCKAAYELGADYIVHIADGAQFQSHWLASAIHTLNSFNPRNVGVVTPVRLEGNDMVTAHMVHRTHMDIFEEFYPVSLNIQSSEEKDWFSDVYGEDAFRAVSDWILVKRLTQVHKRYGHKMAQAEAFHLSVITSKQKLNRYRTYGPVAKVSMLLNDDSIIFLSRTRRVAK